jgi:voltage-gated potassium channel Kch
VTAHGAWRTDGHVIVCGLKGVGLRTVEQLHRSGVSVVVLDDDPDLRLARIIESWGVSHFHRSAHQGDGLTEAGLRPSSAPKPTSSPPSRSPCGCAKHDRTSDW